MGKRDKKDKKDKRIAVQQKIINALTSKNENMKNQIESLETDLEFQKNVPQEGYDEAKALIVKLNGYIKTYEEEINILKSSIEKYNFARKEFYNMKIKCKKEMDGLCKSIKQGTK